MQCPYCYAQNPEGARYCSQCSNQFTVSTNLPFPSANQLPSKKKTSWLFYGAIGFFALCGGCGVLGLIGQVGKKNNLAQTTPTPVEAPKPIAPLATPLPSVADFKTQAAPLLTLNQVETEAQLSRFDKLMSDVAAVPKDSPDYAAAQALQKQLSAKVAPVLAERVLLGEKPTNGQWDGRVDAADAYLKQTLNDYDSSEYLNWTPVTRTTYKKAPCWTTTVRLRAKNAFGAFIVKEIKFYIQQGHVVGVE